MMADAKVATPTSSNLSNVKLENNSNQKNRYPSQNSANNTQQNNSSIKKSSLDNVDNDGQKNHPQQQQNNDSNNKKRKLNNHNNGAAGGGNVKSEQQSQNNQQQNSNNNNNNNNYNYNGGREGGERSSGQYMPGHRLTGSPAWDLQPQNNAAQQFTGRCRLFVANLPNSVTEEALRNLFQEFGQISDIFIGKGNQFAFIKMDTRSNAENAKNALDCKPFEGRTLRVRLAAHAAAVKVSNLPPCVSNELLHYAFSTFGPIERAIVVADDRGRSVNEGIIEFARKSSAQAAIKKCQNECLVLSSSPIPVIAQSLETRDEEEGVPEKNVLHMPEYRKEREIGPRFTEPNSVEHEIAKKWKEFLKHETDRRQAFEAEMHELHENFKTQMEYFRLEETCKQLREQLRQMENQVKQMNTERDARYDYERHREDQRRQHDAVLRQQEEQILGQPHNQNELNALRRQESDLRQQATALQQILDRQEKSLRQIDPSIGQHMDTNMYGQPGMHPGQPGAGPMIGAPGQMAGPGQAAGMQMNPYGPQPTQVNYGHHGHQQQMTHPQINHYGHHPHQMHPQSHPQHPAATQMQRPSMVVPYNGVPPPTSAAPPMGVPPPTQTQAPPYGPQQPQSQQQNNRQQQGGMNHTGGNNGSGGAGGGGNYGGKRTRRY